MLDVAPGAPSDHGQRAARIFGIGNEDYRQAEWLAERLNAEWRYDFGSAQWHHFDGIRWATDKTDQIRRTVATESALMIRDASTDGARKAALRLLSNTPIERALTALATLPGYGTSGDDWDMNPYLLGCANGIVDLRENRLVQATPEMLVTRSTGTNLAPIDSPLAFASAAPRFMEFLTQVTSDFDWTESTEMISFLLLWFGASLFGISPEQRFLILSGTGRNGKGALKHAILSAIGPEYGIQPDANLYSRSQLGPARSNEARADLLSLRGKRIAFFSEPDRGKFNEELLKAHTGGDRITARGLYQREAVSWEPTHSITFLVNDAPSLDDVGPSMGSRIMVADFRHRFEGSAEDKTLYTALANERDGILSILCWVAAAWYDAWQTHGSGLTMPQRVLDQSRRFIERNDPIAECLREVFRIEPGLSCSGREAYAAYLEWHAKSGLDDDPVSNVKFAAALEKKGMQHKRRMHQRAWVGLAPLGALALADREDDNAD